MNAVNEEAQSKTAVARLPLWLPISGLVIFVGSAMLSARLIWEQTVWTWERGPQMVGFSLAHGPGAILFLFPFLLILWAVLVAVLTIRSLIRKERLSSARWAGLALAVVLLTLLGLPDGFWERTCINRMAASPYAGKLLVYAAYEGDFGAVRAFVSHGVPVDTIDRYDWRTALHAAAIKGNLPILRYLLAKGANINAVDRFGDSPLELATSKGHDEAARFLAERGAERIRGDDAQRQKALGDETREEMERQHLGSTTWHR